jgi:hypothetical protein
MVSNNGPEYFGQPPNRPNAKANNNNNRNAPPTTLLKTVRDASGSSGRASTKVHDQFLDAMKGLGTGVKPCRQRSASTCEDDLHNGVRYAPCKLVRTDRVDVCDYATMRDGETRKELDKISARLAKHRVYGSTQNVELRRAWAQSEFRPVIAQVGTSKVKIDRDVKATLKRAAGVLTGKGFSESNALTAAKKVTKRHMKAIHAVHGPDTVKRNIDSKRLGTVAQNPAAAVPTVTEQRMQCALLSGPREPKNATEVRVELCQKSGACEARTTSSGGLDCVPSATYVSALTKQTQRIKRDKRSKKTDAFGLPVDYPKDQGRLVRYQLHDSDETTLREHNGRRSARNLLGLIERVGTGGWSGIASIGKGVYRSGMDVAPGFGLTDEKSPQSCHIYNKKGMTCPLYPRYPTDPNFRLYHYKGRTDPVLGHCTMTDGACVGRLRQLGWIRWRKGTPTYEEMLKETRAHVQRVRAAAKAA